jgi:hypothetical protein
MRGLFICLCGFSWICAPEVKVVDPPEVKVVDLKVPEITGEVGMAIWHDAYEIPIITYQDDEEQPFKGGIRIGSGWNLFLRKVTGVDDATRLAISAAAVSGEGFIRTVANMVNNEPRGMLIEVKGSHALRLTEGTRVKLKNCTFKSGIFGTAMTCEDFDIVPKNAKKGTGTF